MNNPTFNHGFKGITQNGGTCTIKNFEPAIGGGAKNLTQAEMDAYNNATMYADPANGSDWDRAKRTLEAAGFEVFNV